MTDPHSTDPEARRPQDAGGRPFPENTGTQPGNAQSFAQGQQPEPGTAQSFPGAQDPYAGGTPQPGQGVPQQPGAQGGQDGYPQPGEQSGQGGYQQPAPGQGGYQQSAPGNPNDMQVPGSWSDVPPQGMKGVSSAPMTGQPISDSDAKLWAMLAQLSVILGYFFAVLAWVGPLVVYLMYKDRNRFVRFHAAEALNSSIAVLIVSFVLAILTGIFSVITFGLGSPSLALIGVPAIVQIIFAIIAGVKANSRTWWNYPVNIRLFS